MTEPEKQRPRYWFPKKEVGYGWGLPITWQGWVVFVGFIALSVIGSRILIYLKLPLIMIFGWPLVLSFAFVAIVYKTGEPLK